jgi:hypothetical protein|tara:strand:+ start:102 stop:377 length:276 start_codon:yes stop_codon:yes gene_type:complete
MQLAKGEQQVARKRRKRGSINTSLKKYSGKGYSMATLRKVYKRGLGAYYSSGSRTVSAHAWAMGRVRSFVTGRGGARKADADLIRGKRRRR